MNPRHLFFIAAALFAFSPPARGAAPDLRVREPDKLVILSTSDVKGMTSPCGCLVPKGGLARRAAVRDNLATTFGQLLVVDSGGFFPEASDTQGQARAAFLMECMVAVGTDAAGLSEHELGFGRGWLTAQLARTHLVAVCANIRDRTSGETLVPAYRIFEKGTVKVGVFGLAQAKADLGPSRDSLTVEDPAAAAARVVPEMRGQGATVIVLLSQLGQAESEDLLGEVDGIDVLIGGHDVPVVPSNHMVHGTITSYAGQSGHQVGRAVLELDPERRMRSAQGDVVALGPEVSERQDVLARVKRFTDDMNAQSKGARPTVPYPPSDKPKAVPIDWMDAR